MDTMQMVTDRILAQLERGVVPWRRRWISVGGGAYNRISGHHYSLLNQMLLSKTGEYATFRQWHDLGGSIKAGSKAETVVFWKWPEPKQNLENDEETETETDTVQTRPILKYYHVFHVSCTDLEPVKREEKSYDTKPIEKAEKLFWDYIEREGILVDTDSCNRAFYSPESDSIHLPSMDQFESAESYYGVSFHESIHSTAADHRLSRKIRNRFGTADYGFEELVAEVGSSAIMASLGIDTSDTQQQNAAYIDGWVGALKHDKRMIVYASSYAEKACRYIMGEGFSAQ